MHCSPLGSYTVERLLFERASINESPEYQRESGVWSPAKRQLFIDSILNNYDIPKLYFHDLKGDSSHPQYQFAVVDGKQRLNVLWQFIEDDLSLGDDIKPPDSKVPAGQLPQAGDKFSDLDKYWQMRIKSYVLPIVLIENASEEDIEELFSRLNGGEPLTGAEKRNAMGGNMCRLIRELARDKFFPDWAGFTNKRLQYLEAAAKFLIMECTGQGGDDIFCDLKKRFLDDMVKSPEGKGMPQPEIRRLNDSVSSNLRNMRSIFSKGDPLLKKPTFVVLYYAFCREVLRQYGHAHLKTKIHTFLQAFEAERHRNQEKDEDDKTHDATLSEFGRLTRQGNDKESIRERVGILTRYFLRQNPEVSLKDPRRGFSSDARYAIWINSDKKCEECEREIKFTELQADHIRQHAHGGQTVLSNARALCASCNQSLSQRVS